MKRARIAQKSDNLRDWVQANGEPIGKGKDATVYALNNSAYKIFAENTLTHIKQRNVDFLLLYRDTGAVPKIGPVFSVDYGVIQMGLLEGYMTVKKFKQSEHWKNLDLRSVLLKRVWDTRLLFPHNIEFEDFKNMDNIMVNVTSDGSTLNVVFIEGGDVKQNTNDALHQFFEVLCYEISGKKCACYSSIIKYIREHRLR